MKLRIFLAALFITSSAFAATQPQSEVLYFSCTDSSNHTIKLYAVPSPDAKRTSILIVNGFAFIGSSPTNLTTFTSDDGLVTANLTIDSTTGNINAISAVEPNYNLTLNTCTEGSIGG